MREPLTRWGLGLATALVVLAFGHLLLDVVWRGLPTLEWQTLVTAPTDAGRSGGLAPILVSTVLIVGLAIGVSVPLALLAAVGLVMFCRQHPARQRRLRSLLELLAGVPSIVYGLFGNALFGVVLGLGYSVLTGALTLACMALPLMIRLMEEAMQAVPGAIWQGAAAAGLRDWTALHSLIVPVAAPGLTAAVMLGTGRALAETAALMFTSGYVDRWPGSLLDSARALSVHIYDLAMNIPGGESAAYRAALLLLGLILVIQLLTQWLGLRVMRRRYRGALA